MILNNEYQDLNGKSSDDVAKLLLEATPYTLQLSGGEVAMFQALAGSKDSNAAVFADALEEANSAHVG